MTDHPPHPHDPADPPRPDTVAPREGGADSAHVRVVLARGRRRAEARKVMQEDIRTANLAMKAGLAEAGGDLLKARRAQYVYHIDTRIASLAYQRAIIGPGDAPVERLYAALLDDQIARWRRLLVALDTADDAVFRLDGEAGGPCPAPGLATGAPIDD